MSSCMYVRTYARSAPTNTSCCCCCSSLPTLPKHAARAHSITSLTRSLTHSLTRRVLAHLTHSLLAYVFRKYSKEMRPRQEERGNNNKRQQRSLGEDTHTRPLKPTCLLACLLAAFLAQVCLMPLARSLTHSLTMKCMCVVPVVSPNQYAAAVPPAGKHDEKSRAVSRR